MAREHVVEIEFNGARNESHRFRPLGRTFRGRFDPARVADRRGRATLEERWPETVPGQRLVLNITTGRATIVESLHEQPALLAKIQRAGMSVGPEREEFDVPDTNSFAYWMRSAVRAGLATVVQGDFPTIDEKTVRRSYLHEPRPNVTDRLAAALEGLTTLLTTKLQAAK